MYKVKSYLKRLSDSNEYVLMVDEKGKEYISNGVCKWDATINRMSQLQEVGIINKEKFMNYWKSNMGYETISLL